MKSLHHSAASLMIVVATFFSHAFTQQAILANDETPPLIYDVVVYGGTSGGVLAAVQVAKMGKKAVIIEPSQHLGGMTASGLGATDTAGHPEAIGGLARDFYRRVKSHYDKPESWSQESREDYGKRGSYRQTQGMMFVFEPHVTEKIFREMANEAGVEVVYGERLDLKKGVQRDGLRITALRMESGKEFVGSMFIDASYEGDLLPGAGVTYTFGRESGEKYKESYAGVQKRLTVEHQFQLPVDPWVEAGNPASGLLPGMHHPNSKSVGEEGSSDSLIQAFNFRLCVTDKPENRVPFHKPDGYDPKQYELLARYIEAGFDSPLGLSLAMPNRKSDFNSYGPFSVDFLRGTDNYVEGDYAQREKNIRAQTEYQQGLIWFLGHDPRVPEKVRKEMQRWGLSKDEFTDSEHWPFQIYVRESRRMVSDYVMIQQNVLGHRTAKDSVGLACYPMDAHNYQRFVDKNGHAQIEGGIFMFGPGPYPISYRSLIPKRGECENLLVPWSLSASHVAFLSIRMEPVLMGLGQAAATAACLAIDNNQSVQELSYDELRKHLLDGDQLLEVKRRKKIPQSVDPEKLSGIIIDDLDVKGMQDWPCHVDGKFIGHSYRKVRLHKAEARAFEYSVKLPEAGRYEVRYAYDNAHPNWAKRVPLTVKHADGSDTIKVDLSKNPPIDDLWISLGVYRFTTKQAATVSVGLEDAGGTIVTDAVQFLHQKD